VDRIHPTHDRAKKGAVVNKVVNFSSVTGEDIIFHEGDYQLLFNKLCSMKLADKIEQAVPFRFVLKYTKKPLCPKHI
jgi:hypothetical protein